MSKNRHIIMTGIYVLNLTIPSPPRVFEEITSYLIQRFSVNDLCVKTELAIIVQTLFLQLLLFWQWPMLFLILTLKILALNINRQYQKKELPIIAEEWNIGEQSTHQPISNAIPTSPKDHRAIFSLTISISCLFCTGET